VNRLPLLKMGAMWAVILLLLALPASDTTRYLPFLYAQAQLSPQPFGYLRLATELGQSRALTQLSQLARARNDSYWLQYAARRGDPQAQYAFSQDGTNPTLSLHYLTKAAVQGHGKAQLGLFNYWMGQNKPGKAMAWLRAAARQDGPSAVQLARELSLQGKREQAMQALLQGAKLGDEQASMYLQAQLATSGPDERVASSTGPSVERGACSQRLQFLATSLHSLIQGEQFVTRFAKDARLQTLPICINPVIWLRPYQLSCQPDWQGGGRLGCNIADVSPYLKKTNFSHVVVFAGKGKANVHNGFMFLDSRDDYQVFVHELAHFAGFMDEYPLSRELAKASCETLQAPNLRVAPGESQPNATYWQGLKDDVRLSKARTCDNHGYQAYKPTAELTFMEFYDFNNIPDIYLAAWRQSLAVPQQLTPAFINFAQVHEGRKEWEQANYWRARYQQYLDGN
jgi:hypothetical protein